MKPAGVPLAPGQIPGPAARKTETNALDARKSPADGIAYDPLAIARRDAGWNITLEKVLDAWLRKVHKESLTA